MGPGDELGHRAGLRPARAVGGKANRKWSRCKKEGPLTEQNRASGSHSVTPADQDTP